MAGAVIGLILFSSMETREQSCGDAGLWTEQRAWSTWFQTASAYRNCGSGESDSAIVAEFFSAPVAILLSSIYGGILAGVSVGALVPNFSLISYIAGVVATVLGIVVQFMLESRKSKQNVRKPKEPGCRVYGK
ncbi:MAG: hypothetical protein ACLR1N_02310 [Bifidobacterium pseudocatenulatum]